MHRERNEEHLKAHEPHVGTGHPSDEAVQEPEEPAAGGKRASEQDEISDAKQDGSPQVSGEGGTPRSRTHQQKMKTPI